jgi:hypothetical protein
MPPLPVIPDVFRVAITWSGVGGVNPVNVMHFRDLTSSSTAADLAAVINTNWSSEMIWCLSEDQVGALLKITPLDGSSSTQDFNCDPASFVGLSDPQYAPQVAQVVKLVTGVRGRSKRGRVFLGPVAESAMSDGALGAGSGFSGQQPAWGAFEAGLIAAGFQITVASYKLGSDQLVTATVPEQVLATQRRRLSWLR